MFNKTLKKIAVGAAALLSLGTATLASTSADAYPWHGGGWGWGGAAIGAGILGVAVGASLAHPYYGPLPGYGPGPGYYGRPYGYYGGCRSFWRWSPQWGRYVRVARCY